MKEVSIENGLYMISFRNHDSYSKILFQGFETMSGWILRRVVKIWLKMQIKYSKLYQCKTKGNEKYVSVQLVQIETSVNQQKVQY